MRSIPATAPAVNILPRFHDRTTRVLKNADITTPAKLLAFPAEDLRRLPGIGRKGLAEVLAWKATALIAGGKVREAA